MQNLFINPEDEFVINFSVAMDKDDTIFCDTTRESLVDSLESMNKNLDDFNIEDYSATFKKPSFGDTIQLYEKIFQVGADEAVSFNPIVARYNKIVALIKSWNLTGEVNKPNEEEIRKLHPTLATAIGVMLDLETGGIFNV